MTRQFAKKPSAFLGSREEREAAQRETEKRVKRQKASATVTPSFKKLDTPPPKVSTSIKPKPYTHDSRYGSETKFGGFRDPETKEFLPWPYEDKTFIPVKYVPRYKPERYSPSGKQVPGPMLELGRIKELIDPQTGKVDPVHGQVIEYARELDTTPTHQTFGHEVYYTSTGPIRDYPSVKLPPAPSPWQAKQARKTPIPDSAKGGPAPLEIGLHYYSKEWAPPKADLQAATDWARSKSKAAGEYFGRKQAGGYIKRGLPWPGAPAAPSVSGYNRVREAQQGFGRSGVSYSAEPKTYAYEATLQQPEGPKESGLERVVGGFFGTIGDTLFGSSRSHRRRKRRKSGPDTLF